MLRVASLIHLIVDHLRWIGEALPHRGADDVGSRMNLRLPLDRFKRLWLLLRHLRDFHRLSTQQDVPPVDWLLVFLGDLHSLIDVLLAE